MPAWKIGFIGAGHMNSAIIDGLLSSDSGINKNQIMISTRSQQSCDHAAKRYGGVRVTTDNCELIEHAQYLVIGVKPQQMHDLLSVLAQYDLSQTLIITIAAGITLADYRRVLGDEVTIVRAMPNIAAAAQASLTGIYSDDDLDEDDEQVVEEIFSAIGSTAWLDDETQIDGIVALSGSGIAYFFRFMQAMARAGEQYGFEQEELYDILTLTALGAVTLAMESEQTGNFADFVDKIAVAGGTTEQAIAVFDRENLDAIVNRAMEKVIARSKQLSDTLTKDW